MKYISNKEANYSLTNPENYKKEIDVDIDDIVYKLKELIVSYYKFITENITLKKTELTRFIIRRGLDTIINVFYFIFLYTKNLDVAYFHCQKSFYLYVEFVSQITEEEKMFLQLSSRDAATYVYKSTVFNITHELKKNNEYTSEQTRYKIEITNTYIDLFKTLLNKIIDFHDPKNIKTVELIYVKLSNLTNKSKISLLNKLFKQFSYTVENNDLFFDLCIYIIKKINRTNDNINVGLILDKLYSDEFKTKMVNDTSDKISNWLLSN